MEAPTFVAANEDYNLYAFDMRQLKRPTNVHMDHTSAVTCVDFAPTGKLRNFRRLIRITFHEMDLFFRS